MSRCSNGLRLRGGWTHTHTQDEARHTQRAPPGLAFSPRPHCVGWGHGNAPIDVDTVEAESSEKSEEAPPPCHEECAQRSSVPLRPQGKTRDGHDEKAGTEEDEEEVLLGVAWRGMCTHDLWCGVELWGEGPRQPPPLYRKTAPRNVSRRAWVRRLKGAGGLYGHLFPLCASLRHLFRQTPRHTHTAGKADTRHK